MSAASNTILTPEIFRKTLMSIARDCIARGPGFSQERVILRNAGDALQLSSIEDQQHLLTAWHDLFRDGYLSWGYNIDNPNAPFFHITQR